MEGKKMSTDPQENEIDSNIFEKPFRALAGSTDHKDPKSEEKHEDDKTIDEEQDPANH